MKEYVRMSDELTDVVQPDLGQGDGGQGGDPPYAEYLSRIPEDARDDIEPIFKEWDQNVSKKFQDHAEFRKQWEPYQETGVKDLSPDQLSYAVQLFNALEQPDLIKEWFEGYAKENGLTLEQAAQQAADPALDEFGYQDPSQQFEKRLEERLSPLMQKLEQYDGLFAEQQKAQQMAEANQFVDGQIAAIEKEHGKLDDEQKQLLGTLASAYADSDWQHAIQRGWADLQRWQNKFEKNTLQSKLDQPAAAESGGVPDVSPPDHKRINDPAVTNAALEWMRNQNRA